MEFSGDIMQNQCMCTYRDVISNIDFAAQNGVCVNNGDIVANCISIFSSNGQCRPMVTLGLMEQFHQFYVMTDNNPVKYEISNPLPISTTNGILTS